MKSLQANRPLLAAALLLCGPSALAQGVAASAASSVPATRTSDVTSEAPSAPVAETSPSKKDSQKLFKSSVSAADFEKAGLSISFVGLAVQASGNAPTACVIPGLALSDVIKRDPNSATKTEDGFQKAEDVRNAASEVGVRFIFKDPVFKSFSECKIAHENDEDQTDLASVPELKKSILLLKEIAILGFLDGSNKITFGKEPAVSADYHKWSDLVARANCTDCNKNSKTNKKLIAEISEEGTSGNSLMEGLLASSLIQEEEHLDKAKSLREMNSIRGNLLDYSISINKLNSESANKDKLNEELAQDMSKLLAKSNALANEDASHAGKYADFIADTYGKVSELPGLEKESREEALAEKKSFAKGGSERLNFISKMDPNNSEVREYLNSDDRNLASLNRTVAASCRNAWNDRRFQECEAAQQDFRAAQQDSYSLRQRFMAAQRMDALTAPGPMMMSTQRSNSQFQSAPFTTQNNLMYGLNQSVFPNAQSFNPPSAINLYTNNGSAPDASNYQSLYRINSLPSSAIPLNQNYSTMNGPQSNAPINSGNNSPFTPRFQSNS